MHLHANVLKPPVDYFDGTWMTSPFPSAQTVQSHRLIWTLILQTSSKRPMTRCHPFFPVMVRRNHPHRQSQMVPKQAVPPLHETPPAQFWLPTRPQHHVPNHHLLPPVIPVSPSVRNTLRTSIVIATVTDCCYVRNATMELSAKSIPVSIALEHAENGSMLNALASNTFQVTAPINWVA